MTDRMRLLLYVESAAVVGRHAIAGALAGMAAAAGAHFECYYDQARRGLHFGSGSPSDAPTGVAGGSLFSGGGHAQHILLLAHHFDLIVVGDPRSPLWPALEAADADFVDTSSQPASIYVAVLKRLGLVAPKVALVVDGQPQGRHGVVTAPYVAPLFLHLEPALGIDVSCSAEDRQALAALGVERFDARWVDTERGDAFPGALDNREGEVGGAAYDEVTAAIARHHSGWARGVFLGDPDLVAAQLGRIAARRLVPVYGRPQVDVIARVSHLLAGAEEPVFGRQYDDRDFVELARHGRGLQVVDPDPPFDAIRALPPPAHDRYPPPEEPDDEQLRAWADSGTVLVTLCVWAGMVREADALGRIIDLLTITEARAGIVITAETAEHTSALHLLAVPPDRGGLAGQAELLLGSTGRGVAAETMLDPQALTASLRESLTALARRVPPGLVPRGWWPLLDTAFRPVAPKRVAWRRRRPLLYFTPRGQADPADFAASDSQGVGGRSLDARSLAGGVVRRTGLRRMFVERRPFDSVRPGAFDPVLAAAVHAAGLDYMWTKAGFGVPRGIVLDGDFVALPFTAGNWDGWSPFYTAGSVSDVTRAERRLLRAGRPGWLASTVDAPLFAMSGEVWRHGSKLHDLVGLVARGGSSGRLVNVTPHVVARYARLIEDLDRRRPSS